MNRRRLALAAALAAALLASGSALADPGNGKGNGHGKGKVSAKGKPAGAPPAKIVSPGGNQSVQGVVQAVTATGALIRLLDGSTVSVSLGRSTAVVVDGRPSRLTAVRPGYVLVGILRHGHSTTLRFVRPG